MARIGLQTWGSEGDIRPFLNLASALAARGHEVSLVYTDPSGRAAPATSGVRLIEVGRAHTLSAEETDDVLRRCLESKSAIEQGRLLLERTFEPFVPSMFEAARELAAGCDLMVRHYFLHFAQAAAQASAIPELALHVAPDSLPTREHPPTGFPDLGAWLNRASWKVVETGVSRVFAAQVNQYRALAGLTPVKHVLREVWHSPRRNLLAVSPALYPRPQDWPEQHLLSGFLSSPQFADAPLGGGALDFLAAGSPPVFVGFGSLFPSTRAERTRMLELLVEVAKRASVRLMVQGGADGPLAPDVYSFTRCAHEALLPRCATAVHHGGAGTTHAALRAGTPSLVIPHLADQFFWGELLYRRGLGGRPLPRRELTAGRLAERLEELLARRDMRPRLDLIRRSMSGEDGLSVAVAAVDAELQTAYTLRGANSGDRS